jgi:peptidoglycan/LPS O-acetylase OafA/YrhL
MSAAGHTTGNYGSERIASLDGLRAISILLVMVGHIYGRTGLIADERARIFGKMAHFGVEVFFVISGFLITSLLLKERARTGTTDLLAFYMRRSLRIIPPFLVFMVAIVIATQFGWIQTTRADVVHALTYTTNYQLAPSWPLGHLWSLSVEEQFYLLWPLLFLRLSYRGSVIAALVMFAAGPVVRAFMHLLIHHDSYRDLPIFPAVADAIAAGCLVALLRPKLLAWSAYLRFTGSAALWWLLLPVVVVSVFDGYTLVNLFGGPLVLVSVAVLMEACARKHAGVAGTLLNSRPMVFVGMISYSLYLWQQPFLNPQAHEAINVFPLNLALAVVFALLSYFVVERPLMGLRRRWRERPKDGASATHTAVEAP